VEIKIFGPGCTRCETLERRTINVLASLDVAADVEKVSDLDRMADHGVLATPALAVNVLASLDVAADVEKVSDLHRMADHGVLATPALGVNGKVKCSGRKTGAGRATLLVRRAAFRRLQA